MLNKEIQRTQKSPYVFCDAWVENGGKKILKLNLFFSKRAIFLKEVKNNWQFQYFGIGSWSRWMIKEWKKYFWKESQNEISNLLMTDRLSVCLSFIDSH